MTAKQTADKLYLKYIAALNIRNDMRNGANPFAKECALICVEKIITSFPDCELYDIPIKELNYWQEVKSELEKL